MTSLAMRFTFCLLLAAVDGGLFSSSVSRELTQYRERVDILHQMLIDENCIQPKSFRLRREVLSSSDGLHLAVEKKLFNNLSDLLISCRLAKESTAPTTPTSLSIPSSGTSTTQSSTTTTPTTFPTTTPRTRTPSPTSTSVATTTSLPVPIECVQAQNLTEEMRRTHRGKSLKDGTEICDTRSMINASAPWFRFTGNAGNRLEDKCVPNHSCGSDGGIWSDEASIQSPVGVREQVNAYISWSSRCQKQVLKIDVMRCSNKANDFIYRYADTFTYCNYAFCGKI